MRSSLPALSRIGHGHITVRQAQAALPEDVWRAYFKFAFTRNPYDRVGKSGRVAPTSRLRRTPLAAAQAVFPLP